MSRRNCKGKSKREGYLGGNSSCVMLTLGGGSKISVFLTTSYGFSLSSKKIWDTWMGGLPEYIGLSFVLKKTTKTIIPTHIAVGRGRKAKHKFLQKDG